MALYKPRATQRFVKSFITLTKDQKSIRQNIKIANNTLTILDDTNQLIQQITPPAKILPPGINNQQINQRSLIQALDDVVKGLNLTVFYIGASFSGKQQLFDGSKGSDPLICHFLQRVIPALKREGRLQLRLKMNVIISEKVYDCLSDSRHAVVRIKQDKWQGVQLNNTKPVPIQSSEDFKKQIARGIKHKNKLILQFKEIYTSLLTLQIVRKHPQNQRLNIVNKVSIIEIPGVQALSSSHNSIKIKQASNSTRSLLSFSAILNDLSKDPDLIPHFQSSALTYLLKQYLAGNSLIYSIFTLGITDIDGSIATLKFLKPFQTLNQYPIINQSNSFGLIKKFRLHASQNMKKEDGSQGQKRQLEEQMLRLQTQQDYKRLMEKYVELKNKYNQALKTKSQAQLQLIKCQQEKLQISKSLVQVQIQNTKLLQKLQNKDYETGKKLLLAQNLLAEKELSYQQLKDKIRQLSQALNQALQTKRDLEVQFIALKRNFILVQKQLKQLKEDNQNLALDLINVSNQNQRLKKQLLNTQPFGDQRSRLVKDLQYQKGQQIKRQRKQMQDTIAYLKSQLQRYKRQMVELQMNSQNLKNSRNGTDKQFGKNYQRIDLENQKLQLINKNKLYIRKIQQLEEKVGFFEQQNGILEDQNRKMKLKQQVQIQRFRKKVEQFTKNTNYQSIVKQLRQNFNRKDNQNLDKINSLKRDSSEKKRQIIKLKGYLRQLQALLEQWAPKGVEIPTIKKYENMDFSLQGSQGAISDMKVRNIKLQEQLRRVKQSMHGSPQFRSSRVSQQMSILRGTQHSNKQAGQLRQQRDKVAEQNRRLTTLLKDGNKMDLNIIKKQNDNLKRELQALKSKSSISPSTGEQKLQFYQKHIKALQKERSQLLSRCVVAEQQLKNILGKIGKQAAY